MTIVENPGPTGQTADELTAPPLSQTKQRLLARLRADRAAARAPAGLVRLRPGDPDPVVLIHPVDGDLLCYTGLVRDLPAGRLVLGVAAEPVITTTTVEELAARALALLTGAGVHPAALAGWSVGGVIAYEMARQARSTGQPVGSLVLIDSVPVPPEHAGAERPLPMLLADFAEYLARWAGAGQVAARLPATVWPADVVPALDHLAGLFTAAGTPLDQSREQLQASFHGYARISRAVDRYRLRPSQVPIIHIRGSESPVRPEHWPGAVVGADHVLPGDHYTLLQSPAVAAVAKLVAATATA